MTEMLPLVLPTSPKGIHRLTSPDCKLVLLFASLIVTLFFLRALDHGVADSQESCDMVSRRSVDPAVDASNPLPPHLRPGCILYSDNRSISAHAATRGLTPAAAAAVAGWGAASPILSLEDLAQLPYYESSRIINKLYAERHGYLFFESYEGANSSRKFTWHKVTLLRHALQCCCRWALYVDSDAYLRMDMHRLSVEDWAARVSKRGYFDRLLGLSDSRLQAQLINVERTLDVLTPHDGQGGQEGGGKEEVEGEQEQQEGEGQQQEEDKKQEEQQQHPVAAPEQQTPEQQQQKQPRQEQQQQQEQQQLEQKQEQKPQQEQQPQQQQDPVLVEANLVSPPVSRKLLQTSEPASSPVSEAPPSTPSAAPSSSPSDSSPSDSSTSDPSPSYWSPSNSSSSKRPFAVFVRNGDGSLGYHGEPQHMYNPEYDWANAGVVLFGHSPDTFKFLDQWYAAILPEFGDQRPMNLVSLKWKKQLVVVPYLEWTGPEGIMIRHFWHPVGGDTRNYELQKALLGVLVQQHLEGRR